MKLKGRQQFDLFTNDLGETAPQVSKQGKVNWNLMKHLEAKKQNN